MAINDINEEVAKAGNDLLEYLYDSCNGYQECAEQVADPTMKQLFSDLAQHRQQMISELKTQVRMSDEEPTESGSITGAAHRRFIDVKSLLTGGNTESIVKEVKRGESYTIDRYKEILSKNLPSAIKQILLKQLTEIESDVAKIDAIKNRSIM